MLSIHNPLSKRIKIYLVRLTYISHTSTIMFSFDKGISFAISIPVLLHVSTKWLSILTGIFFIHRRMTIHVYILSHPSYMWHERLMGVMSQSRYHLMTISSQRFSHVYHVIDTTMWIYLGCLIFVLMIFNICVTPLVI